MPSPINPDQTVTVINQALQTTNAGFTISDLNTTQKSRADWSCNNFASDILVYAYNVTGSKEKSQREYKRDDSLPDSFDNATLVNISMLGEPSSLNHNFNIFVNNDLRTTYIIQAFLNHEVNIITRIQNEVFISEWRNLSNKDKWKQSYSNLFGVDPKNVEPDLQEDQIWLSYQYVSY